LINTSFNVRSEPIVCTPEDAYRCFMATQMDVLVLGRQVVYREQQAQQSQEATERHLAQFALD
jgi:carbamoyltransferase